MIENSACDTSDREANDYEISNDENNSLEAINESVALVEPVHKAIKKRILIRSLNKKELDLSIYGARRRGRIYAMFALYSYDMNARQVTMAELLQFSYEDKAIDDNVLSFAKEIIIGTIENLDFIDGKIIDTSENWHFDRIQYVDRAIIRLSIYALYFQKDIPRSVVIDEALEIAKIFSDKDSYKFINGILDGNKKN